MRSEPRSPSSGPPCMVGPDQARLRDAGRSGRERRRRRSAWRRPRGWHRNCPTGRMMRLGFRPAASRVLLWKDTAASLMRLGQGGAIAAGSGRGGVRRGLRACPRPDQLPSPRADSVRHRAGRPQARADPGRDPVPHRRRLDHSSPGRGSHRVSPLPEALISRRRTLHLVYLGPDGPEDLDLAAARALPDRTPPR